MKTSFASDNYAPAHPRILQSIMEINHGLTGAYGSDPWTLEAHELIQKTIGRKGKVLLLPTGTGSNVLALKLACKSHESILATDIAHLNLQESGACEAIVGAKIISIPHHLGKLPPNLLKKRVTMERSFGLHATSPRVVSITQPTEYGTVYTLDELREIAQICKQENLLLHIDGSRIYNAAIFLNCSLQEIIDAANPDLLSLGGTKNGLMGAESLIILNPSLTDGADYLQKQTLQLLSKMRYLAVQYLPFLKENLWHALASHANKMAKKLEQIILETPCLTLNYPVETNQLFFSVPQALIPAIQEEIGCYVWDLEKSELRFVTSWATTEEDLAHARSTLASLAKD